MPDPSFNPKSAIRNPQCAVGDQGDAMVIGYEAAAERIELELGGKPAGAVLDIGCNTGAGMAALIIRWPHAELYGIEPVSEFAHAARGKGLIVATARAESLPYGKGFFGLVFSRHSLEHVADQEAAITEFHRVLRPGGHLYVQAPIEPAGSPNHLHESPFLSLGEFRNAFGLFDEIYFGPQETVAEFIGMKL